MEYRRKKPLTLQTRITLLICCVLGLALTVTHLMVSQRVAALTERFIEDKAVNVSHFVAKSETVREALQGVAPLDTVQALAESVRGVSSVEYIVVLDMNGIRLSHPNPSLIGQRFVGGDDDAVYGGMEYTSTAEGTLGPSLRSFTPVYDEQGTQIGAVAVGILLNEINQQVDKTQLMVLIGVLAGFIIGLPGALLLAGRIKKILFGLEPDEIARIFEERNALMHSVREGILGVDRELRITVVNDAADRLFSAAGIPTEMAGHLVEDVVPNTHLHRVIETGIPEYDQEQEVNGIQILTNRLPIRVDGQIVGAVATFRDKTEITRMAEQLTGVRLYAEALRSQTHEFMNRLHVIMGMIHMGHYERLTGYITEISGRFQDEVGFVMSRIKDPVLAGFVMAKLSSARERGVFFSLSDDTGVPEMPDVSSESDIATILGNLIENAMEAVEGCPVREIVLHMQYGEELLTIRVSDTGEGIPPEHLAIITEKGYSTRGENRGYGMYHIARLVEGYQGTLTLAPGANGGTVAKVELPLSLREVDHD